MAARRGRSWRANSTISGKEIVVAPKFPGTDLLSFGERTSLERARERRDDAI